MSEETGAEKRTRRSNGPTIRGRAGDYVDATFNRQKLTYAFREGYRVFNGLMGLKMEFTLTSAFETWHDGQCYNDLERNSKVAIKEAFAAGCNDAEDRAPKTQDDPTKDMFEAGRGEEQEEPPPVPHLDDPDYRAL